MRCRSRERRPPPPPQWQLWPRSPRDVAIPGATNDVDCEDVTKTDQPACRDIPWGHGCSGPRPPFTPDTSAHEADCNVLTTLETSPIPYVPTGINHKELPAGFRGTTSGETAKPTSTYTALLTKVRDAGLLERRRGLYITVFTIVTASLAAAVTWFFLIGPSWFQLLIAAGIGLIFTQYGFLAHETAHRQVFESGKTSDRVGRILASGVVGMS